MGVGSQVSWAEPEALASDVSRKEEKAQREGGAQGAVPPHRKGQASLALLSLCFPLGLWLFPPRAAGGSGVLVTISLLLKWTHK